MNDPAPYAPALAGAPLPAGEQEVPPVASARRYLRDAVPSIYRTEGSFAQRFLHALERMLDPRVAIVDSLAAYLAPRLAPDSMVDAMAGWLGLELGDAPAGIPRRALLDHAEEIARKRGTRVGLELALRVAFPGLELRLQDSGRVAVGDRVADPPPPPNPGFVVRCPDRLTSSQREAIEWLIAREAPLHVDYRLVDAHESPEPAR
jgi:phage tail-like protein